MGRTVRARRKEPALRPVQKVEVPTKHVKLRIFGAVVFLIIGAAALGYALSAYTSAPNGWQEIQVEDLDSSCAGDFQLIYDLGSSGKSARKENRELLSVYSAACQEAYKIFNAESEFSGVGGLASLNLHPNEEVQISPVLYEALELIASAGERRIYLGPAFDIYDSIFTCSEEWQTSGFDPAQNQEIAGIFSRVAAFASDPESVDIRLLGDGQAMLYVSEEYLDYAVSQELGPFVDLYFLKNAFIADLLAEKLTDAGFTCGSLSSYDGFARNLDGRSSNQYSLNILGAATGRAVVAARLDYSGPEALVTFRSFPAGENDWWYYRVMSDGSVRHRYLSLNEGLQSDTAESVVVYSDSLTCAETALQALGVFLDGDNITGLTDAEGILVEGSLITYTDPAASLNQLYTGYTARIVN